MEPLDSDLSSFLNYFFANPSRLDIADKLNLGGEKCLDLACGSGVLINKYLNRRYKKLVGVDVSPKLINIANKSKNDNSVFIRANITKFIDNEIKLKHKYDTVYMLAILEHMMWPIDLINKVSQLIKKGGRLVIETPNAVWLPYRISMLLGKFPVTAQTSGVIAGVYDEHIRFFTFKTLREVLEKNGLDFVKYDCSGKFGIIKRIFPSLFSPDIFLVYEKK